MCWFCNKSLSDFSFSGPERSSGDGSSKEESDHHRGQQHEGWSPAPEARNPWEPRCPPIQPPVGQRQQPQQGWHPRPEERSHHRSKRELPRGRVSSLEMVLVDLNRSWVLGSRTPPGDIMDFIKVYVRLERFSSLFALQNNSASAGMTRRNTYVCSDRNNTDRLSVIPNGKENRWEFHPESGHPRVSLGFSSPLESSSFLFFSLFYWSCLADPSSVFIFSVLFYFPSFGHEQHDWDGLWH